jgi:hypothetical protein
MRLCAAAFTSSQRNPRYCDSAVGRSILTKDEETGYSRTCLAGIADTISPHGVFPPVAGVHQGLSWHGKYDGDIL